MIVHLADLADEFNDFMAMDLELFLELAKQLSTDDGVWNSVHMRTNFPNLARVAKHIFCCKVMTATCERSFSRYGLIQTKQRSRMSHQKLFKLI